MALKPYLDGCRTHYGNGYHVVLLYEALGTVFLIAFGSTKRIAAAVFYSACNRVTNCCETCDRKTSCPLSNVWVLDKL